MPLFGISTQPIVLDDLPHSDISQEFSLVTGRASETPENWPLGLHSISEVEMTFRSIKGLSFLFCLAFLGCSQTTRNGPEWPKQPSPSYPTPGEPAAKGEGKPPTVPAEKAEHVQAESRLAKKYDGKAPLDTLKGKATYYADSLAGNHTANGDIYDPDEFTGAHKKLPFGSVVRVIREDTGQVTYVTINDRGPFGPSDRILDLSKAAAKQIDMLKAGVVSVRVEVLEKPSKK